MKSLLKKTWGNSIAFSEILLAYHNTPIGPKLPTPSQLMNSYHIRSKLPVKNLNDCDTGVLGNRAQYKQRNTENIQPSKYILDDCVWVQDPVSKEWLSVTITGLTAKSDAYFVIKDSTNKSHEHNVNYLCPRSCPEWTEECTPATPAPKPMAYPKKWDVFPSDVLVQPEPTAAIVEPLTKFMTLPRPTTEVNQAARDAHGGQKIEVPACETTLRRSTCT